MTTITNANGMREYRVYYCYKHDREVRLYCNPEAAIEVLCPALDGRDKMELISEMKNIGGKNNA